MTGGTKIYGVTVKTHTTDALQYQLKFGGYTDAEAALAHIYRVGMIADENTPNAAIALYIRGLSSMGIRALITAASKK